MPPSSESSGPYLLICRSGQIVLGHPLPSGLGVRVREMVQVVPLVPAWVAVSVAVSPDDDCFLPNPGRMTADLPPGFVQAHPEVVGMSLVGRQAD
jgi:hypothetical protein